MAAKSKKQNESIELEGELLNTVSYATFYCRLPLFTSFKIFNRSEDNVQALVINITGSTELILPAEITVDEIPHESSIEINAENLLNPKYLAELESEENCTVQVKVMSGKDIICTLKADVCALPIDCWSGLSGNPEMLATFVRPKLADCQKVLAEAGLQLKTWGYSSEWSGYSGNDRNGVRNAVAAVYAAIRHLEIESEKGANLTQTVSAGDISKILQTKKATPLELALFAASCFESTKLNPVLVLGKNKVGVGVWLYESCFSSPIQDEMTVIEKYVTDGVNNLTVFEADDLFAHKNASYTTSESHFSNSLKNKAFDVCLDIRRCRVGGIFPLPLKIKTSHGYELLDDRQLSYSEKPREVIDASKFDYDRTASKDKSWQRRLLDLSLKNNLLNFRYTRDCLHVLSTDMSVFCEKLEARDKFTLLPNTTAIKDAAYFGGGAGVRNMGLRLLTEIAIYQWSRR